MRCPEIALATGIKQNTVRAILNRHDLLFKKTFGKWGLI